MCIEITPKVHDYYDCNQNKMAALVNVHVLHFEKLISPPKHGP